MLPQLKYMAAMTMEKGMERKLENFDDFGKSKCCAE